MEFRYNDAKIDVHSQRIILALQGGRTRRASELARVAGLVDDEGDPVPEQARYRVREHMEPAGLVEVAGTGRVQGGEATFFALTETGEEALAGELPPEFGCEPTVSTNAQRIEENEEEIEALWEYVQSNRSRINDRATRQSVQRTQQRMDEQLEEMEEYVGEAKQFMLKSWEAAREARQAQ